MDRKDIKITMDGAAVYDKKTNEYGTRKPMQKVKNKDVETKKICWYGNNCKKADCPFRHPKSYKHPSYTTRENNQKGKLILH